MSLSGIKLPHKKGTAGSETVELPLPKKVVIPMSMGMGAPCEPLVKKGDEVKVGEKIGDSDKFMSAPIHSSVSGKVTAVEDYLLSNGRVCKSVVIETDGEQKLSPDIKPPQVTDKASLCAAIKESGCVGLGGAGFPTHIKLNYNESKAHVDSLVINAAECEPYITSDCRTMIEEPDDAAEGIRAVMKYLNIENAYIGIEDNKPDAIKLMRERTSDDGNIKVVKLKSSYPQGAEKVMAYNTTGRIIGEGELPSDKGIIVMNISTAAFIAKYLRTGMPLVSRRVTVDGDIVSKPMNIKVPIGTPIREVLEYAETDVSRAKKILMGGPMMGVCVYDPETPVIKVNNAILAFEKLAARKENPTNCISCGRCISVCPLKLMPCRFEKAYDARDKETLIRLKIGLCMNCGACSYVCPAKRQLAEKNQLAKSFIRT